MEPPVPLLASAVMTIDRVLARKMWRTLEPYHGMIYFVPEAEQESPEPQGGLPSRQQLWPTPPQGLRQMPLTLHTSGDWQRGSLSQHVSPAMPHGRRHLLLALQRSPELQT